MIAEILKDTILLHLGRLKSTPKGWLTRNCMLCHTQGHSLDKRGRFGLLIEPDGSIAINCFNCGFDVVWKPGDELTEKFRLFLREAGIPSEDIMKLNFQAFKEAKNLSDGKQLILKGAVTHKWTPRELPKNSKPILELLENGCNDTNFLNVVNYAIRRQLTNLEDFYWSPEKTHLFSRRLILPFYYNDNIVGYTGRFYKDDNNKSIPKYLNQMPDSYIYNLDAQHDDRKYVILCEGVFDAYFTDGISPINSSINNDQIDIINNLGKIIIVCPDKDKDGDEFIKIAIEQGWHVAFPEWGRGVKDPAKAVELYGRILTVKSIIDSAESYSTKIQLKWSLGIRERRKGLYKGN